MTFAAFLIGLVLLGSLLGSLVAWLRAFVGLFRRPSDPVRPVRRVRPVRPTRRPRPARPPIIVDGSNVMHWAEGVPSARTLALVLEELQGRGYDPMVWFDANVGYKLDGRYLRPADLALMLPVPADAIRVADRGEPADPLLIAAALRVRAPVVSNDRFMDWRAEFPQLKAKGVLVKGRLRGDAVELTL